MPLPCIGYYPVFFCRAYSIFCFNQTYQTFFGREPVMKTHNFAGIKRWVIAHNRHQSTAIGLYRIELSRC